MSHLFAAPHTASPIGAAATGAGAAGGAASVTFALLIVLAAIFAFAWIARRIRGFGSRSGNALDVIAEMPLGPKERAVLLRVGAEQILLGVAPGRVSALHVLREPVEPAKPATPAAAGTQPERPSFRALLKRSLGK